MTSAHRMEGGKRGMKMRREGRQVKINVVLSPSEKKRNTADIRAPAEVKRKNRW